MTNPYTTWLITVIVTGILGVPAHRAVLCAQSTNASIRGRITDPSSAVIVAARIVAVRTDTNVPFETTSDASGGYYLANLPPGPYRIEIEKAGFKKLIKPDVILHVQDALRPRLRDDARIAVRESFHGGSGSASGEYTVGTVSTVIDRTFVDNLPLNGRSFQTLIMLTPGTVVVTATSVQRPGTVQRERPTRGCELLHRGRRQRQFRRHRLLSHDADRERRAAGAQRVGRNEQPGVGGCHAGVSHPDVFVCARVRTHARRTGLDRDALGNQCVSWLAVRILQERRAGRQRLVRELQWSGQTRGAAE